MGELRSHGWSELSAKQLGRQVNVWRMRRQLQVSELARLVGVTPSLISQIERGNAQPSVATLFALAQALDVPVDAFFGGIGGDHAESEWGSDEWLGTPRDEVSEPMADHAFFVAESERDSLETEGGVRWERLTARQIPNIDFLEIVYAPGSESHPEPYSHLGSEVVLMLSGVLEITIDGEVFLLEEGDTLHFPSTQPHRYCNPSQVEEARAVSVILHDGVLD